MADLRIFYDWVFGEEGTSVYARKWLSQKGWTAPLGDVKEI